jgi:hypothetical protein
MNPILGCAGKIVHQGWSICRGYVAARPVRLTSSMLFLHSGGKETVSASFFRPSQWKTQEFRPHLQ